MATSTVEYVCFCTSCNILLLSGCIKMLTKKIKNIKFHHHCVRIPLFTHSLFYSCYVVTSASAKF